MVFPNWALWENQRHESEGFLRRIEAAQRLQGCCRLRDCRVAHDPNRHAGLSISGDSQLDCPVGDLGGRDRISNRARHCVGFRDDSRGVKRTEAADAAGERSRGGVWIAVVAIAAALSVGLFFVGRYTAKNATPRHSEAAIAVPEKSIAVLPLLNESGDPRDEYFSDGLSEELIAALSQIKELKVIGRSSSFRFKDTKEEPKTIGEKLGVGTLLEGTVRKQGDRVRIVAELINAADGIQLWSRTFERELKDIFAVQAEIANAVATSLELTLRGAKDSVVATASTASVEAHNAYLQGHFYFARRNLDDYRKAVGFFDQAIRIDPDYALAYAERSEAWTFIGDLAIGEKRTLGLRRNMMPRRPSRSARISPRHTRLWVGFGFFRMEVFRRLGRTETRE